MVEGTLSLGSDGEVEFANPRLQSLIQKIDHHPHPGRVADPFMCKEPHCAAVAAERGEAADEIGVVVGDDAWQDRDAEARAHRG